MDAYLRVVGRDGNTLESDDDSGSGMNARAEFEAPVYRRVLRHRTTYGSAAPGRMEFGWMRGEEGSMGLTRHHRPIGSLLAVALVLVASFLPAAAQSGSEAVVCVGSETRTLQTNPIRRVYTEDMEIVYRIGVDIGQRDQMERTLGAELGSYPEVWCAWSDPGDDHAVIISYTGVIRQDLTVDPEDPRFQAFSVGFGTDFDAAESQATTINQRFSSRNDGSDSKCC